MVYIEGMKKKSKRTYYIYALSDPSNHKVYYVGITKTPKLRFRAHWNDRDFVYNYRFKTPVIKNVWLKKIEKRKLMVQMMFLEICRNSSARSAYQKEIGWIRYFNKQNPKLTNMDKH